MKNLVSLILILFGCACCEVNYSEFSATLLEVRYVGDIVEGEWIEIDGIRLIHKDVEGALSNPEYVGLDSLETLAVLESLEDDYYLPVTVSKVYHPGFQKWIEDRNNSIMMSYYLYLQFVRKYQAASGMVLSDNNFPYEIENNALLMTKGVLKIARKDGQPLTIKTSKGYDVTIRGID